MALRNILGLNEDIKKMYHYDQTRPTKVKCGASFSGLGASLEQEIEKEGMSGHQLLLLLLSGTNKNIAGKNSNYLPLFGHVIIFGNDLLGNRFELLTDLKAKISARKSIRENKTHHSGGHGGKTCC